MAPKLRTGIYHMQTHDADFDVAHLYEHLLVASFESYLEQHGHSKYLYGWMSGETFREVIFIDYGLYSPDAENLLTEFMAKPDRINLDLLDSTLKVIQAEDKSIIAVRNDELLRQQLDTLDKRQLISDVDDFTSKYIQPNSDTSTGALSLKTGTSKFSDIVVSISLAGLDLEEKLTLLRLRPLVQGAIEKELTSAGLKAVEHTQTIALDQDMLMLASLFSISSNDLSLPKLTDVTNLAINNLIAAVNQQPSAIENYKASFLATPTWNSLIIDYYRYAGILTSRQSIAGQLTPERISKVLQDITVSVRLADSNDIQTIVANS